VSLDESELLDFQTDRSKSGIDWNDRIPTPKTDQGTRIEWNSLPVMKTSSGFRLAGSKLTGRVQVSPVSQGVVGLAKFSHVGATACLLCNAFIL